VGEQQCAVIDELITIRQEVSKLTTQALTDTLTGLGNYRSFCQVIDNEMERTQRTAQPTAMILVDLDFFKKVNDNYGHEAGNIALIQTSKILKAGVRKLDVPCRYGGEEFIVVLPSTDLLTSTQVAERLRKMIADTPVDLGETTITVTASMGVDIYNHTHNETREQFIARVDALLYEAKESGRNKVCSGTQSSMHSMTTVTTDEKDALFGLFGNDDS
jgi:diguanylate cyclase (GGDEF)-like protein